MATLLSNDTMFTEPEPPKTINQQVSYQEQEETMPDEWKLVTKQRTERVSNPAWASWDQRKQAFNANKAKQQEQAKQTPTPEPTPMPQPTPTFQPTAIPETKTSLIDPKSSVSQVYSGQYEYPTEPEPEPQNPVEPPEPEFIEEEYNTGQFDTAEYLRQNPDVARHHYFGSRPHLHYQRHGKGEGRKYTSIKETRQVKNPAYKGTPSSKSSQSTNIGNQNVSDTSNTNEEESDPRVILPKVNDPNVINKPILDIKGTQAVGIPNIITQTGKAGKPLVDEDGKVTGIDTSGIEMLYTPEAQRVRYNELLSGPGALSTDKESTVDIGDPTATTYTDAVADTSEASVVDNIERSYSSLPTAEAVQGNITSNDVIDPNQVVDERTRTEMFERGSLAEAKTQTLAQEASTAYQIEKLTEGIETGKFPPWASPTVRKVNELMNQRGLGASSMAAAAVAQGLMESAIPIAADVAQKFATLQIQNLNNEQQTALANAATIAAMDRQNLDNRMKAAQQNAQSFLQMNLTNVSNKQAMNTLNHQSKVQSLFTDQAAENARLQFNATSQNQVNQFYDQLSTSVSLENEARNTANQQFNSNQNLAVAQYNSKLRDSREKFNSNLSLQIEQANATWRRTINTANTAEKNKANQLNAATLLGITVKAQEEMWQKYRDDVAQAFTASENEEARVQQTALTVLNQQFEQSLLNQQLDAAEKEAVGSLLGKVTTSVLGGVVDVLKSKFITPTPSTGP